MSCNPTTCKYRTTKLGAKIVGGVQITTREWDEYRNYSLSGREQRDGVFFWILKALKTNQQHL